MVNTVKASKIPEQTKVVKSNVSVSHHRFFNAVMMAVKRKIEDQTGLELRYGGKEVSGSNISASLRGEMIDVEGDLDDKVRQTMDTLKNPSLLMSSLE